jgi:hypothetical protein
MTDSPDTAGKPIKAALIQFALPLSALVLLAGCKSEPQQNDFLYSDDEGVLFVHWTWGGRQIGGTIDVVEREPIGEIRKTVLVFDGTSGQKNGITKLGWISSLRVTTQTFRADSPALMRR